MTAPSENRRVRARIGNDLAPDLCDDHDRVMSPGGDLLAPVSVRGNFMKRTIAAVLTLTVTSCSFVFVDGPANLGHPPAAYDDCTDSMTWPIVDGVIAASMLLSGAGVLGATRDESDSAEDGGAAGAVSAVLMAAAFGASAYIGYSRVKKCDRSHAAFIAANPNGTRGQYAGGGQPVQPTQPMHQPVVPINPPTALVGQQGGYCTPQNTCNPGLVCAGMADRTNRCMPEQTQPVQPVQPAQPLVGQNGGACTPQLTCNTGLVCAGMPDRTNKCIPQPAAGTQGGACMANNACNTGLVCAGMPDRTNKCMPVR
jgi:hypothetical protein